MKKWLVLIGIFAMGFLSHLYLVYVFKPDIKPTYSISTFGGKAASDASEHGAEHSSLPATTSGSEIFVGYLKLAGITYFGDGHARNKAIIEDLLNSQQTDYSLKSVLPYGGELTQIFKDKIVIKKEGREKTLELLESLDDPEERKSLLARGYQKVAHDEWLVMPNHLHLDKNIENTLLEAKITTHFTKGVQRFRLDSFPDGGLFEELGFKPGDSIKTIDGEDLTDIQHILRICWKIRNSSLISVELERSHHPVNLSYRIVPKNSSM